MNLSTNYEFNDYIFDIFIWLVILKLLRYDRSSKYISFLLLLIGSIFSIIGMATATLISPFIFFGLSNKELEIAYKVALPIVIISLILYFKNSILELPRQLGNAYEEENNKIGINIAKDLGDNRDLKSLLDEYFFLLKNEIENHFLYTLAFFGLSILIIFDSYNHPHQIHIPAFGIIENIAIEYFISKWNLIWIIPTSVGISYIYSKYYLSTVLNPIYEKFNTICILIAKSKRTVAMNKSLDIEVIDNKEIEEHYRISESLNFIKLKDEIYFIFEKKLNYRKFKSVYQYFRIEGYKHFEKEFYKDFSKH